MSESGGDEELSPIVIHIGFWRTGTTTLQLRFFPSLVGTTFLSRASERRGDLFRLLAQNTCFAPDPQFLGDTFRAYLDQHRRRADGTLIVSHEPFAGAVYDGGFNRWMVMERLHRVAPDARILLVVRRQDTMIPSVHNYYVQKGGSGSFAAFVRNGVEGSDFDLDDLAYDELVRRYQATFGVDRVKVLAFEHLMSEPERFFAEVARYVGGEVPVGKPAVPRAENRSLSAPSEWMLRRANRLFRRSRFNARPLVAEVAHAQDLRRVLQEHVDPVLFRRRRAGLDEEAIDLLHDLVQRYHESNERLAALTGLPLRELGYPMAPVRAGALTT